jgi:phosphoglycolate phosphatase-like HAD superfamily hydrolase
MKKNLPSLSEYQTLVFDCDGVILDSNALKSEAFFQSVIEYGKEKATALRDYHQKHGGISRYVKFDYFINHYLNDHPQKPSVAALAKRYSEETVNGLLSCEFNQDVKLLRESLKDSHWLVASGGDQNDLRHVFARRQLEPMFQGGIFGSPDKKDVILARELAKGNIRGKALYIGDSLYDFKAARSVGLDFVFLSQWTEVTDWQEHQTTLNFASCQSLQELL